MPTTKSTTKFVVQKAMGVMFYRVGKPAKTLEEAVRRCQRIKGTARVLEYDGWKPVEVFCQGACVHNLRFKRFT